MTHIPISGDMSRFGGGPPNTQRSTPVYISPAAVDNRATAVPSSTADQRMLDFARRAGSGTVTRPPGDVAREAWPSASRAEQGLGLNLSSVGQIERAFQAPPAFSPEAVRQTPVATVGTPTTRSPEAARAGTISQRVADPADRALINIAKALGSGTVSRRGVVSGQSAADRAMMDFAERVGPGTVTVPPPVAAPSPYGLNPQMIVPPPPLTGAATNPDFDMGGPFPNAPNPDFDMGGPFPNAPNPDFDMGGPFPNAPNPNFDMGGPFPNAPNPDFDMGGPFPNVPNPDFDMGGPFPNAPGPAAPAAPVPDTSDPGPPSMWGPNPQMPVPGGDFGGDDFGGDDFSGGDPLDIVNPDTDPVSPFEGVDGNSSDYARKLAYINFLRDALGRQGLRGFADIEREFLLAQRALPGAYNRRGLLDSGQYARGKGLLGDSASRATGRFMSDLRDQYFNLALSEGDADNAYSSEGFAALQALADKLAGEAASIGTVGFGAI